jgi:hypothetical protein
VNDVELAPAAIARVASTPLEALSELAEPELVDLARAACDGRCSWSRFEAAYGEATDAGQERLWARTAGDEFFRLALAFANPSLVDKIASMPPRERRTKKRRHLETTLCRYLARSAGRCSPFGLWAGVTMVGWGKENRIDRTDPVIKVTPNLRPLFTLVRMLALKPGYLSRGPWLLNPTLRREADGSCLFWAPSPAGAVARRVRGSDAVVERLASFGPSSLDDLADALEPSCAGRRSARATLEMCVSGGVLVGGLQPPLRFRSPWEALESIEAEVLAEDRGAWRELRISLQSCCHELERRGMALDARDVVKATAAATTTIAALATALGLPCPDLPRALLRCDLRTGLEIQLDESMRSRIEQTLREYLRFQGSYGFGEAVRRALLAGYVPAGARNLDLSAVAQPETTSPPTPTWQGLGEAISADGDFFARIERWQKLLAETGDRVVADGQGNLVAPPFGWIRIGLTAPPGSSPGLVVHGVLDDLWGLYARHADLLGDGAREDAIGAWIAKRIAEVSAGCGIELAEIVAPCDQNPNVLARPSLGRPLVSPWSCRSDAIDLQGAYLAIDSERGTSLLVASGEAAPVVVLNATSANVQAGDPIVQLLLTTSLSATPGAALHAASVQFDHELGNTRPSPEVVLSGGASVRSRRNVLGGEAVQTLVQGNVARRFAAWSQLAGRYEWPRFVRASREDGLAMTIHRDSPLVVAALLEGAGSRVLMVEHWPGGAWLADCGGPRVAELAIPFLRRDHVWSRRQASQCAGSSTGTTWENG